MRPFSNSHNNPFSNSPSTPSRKGKNPLFSNPSTTPAGPPPSYLSNKSTTPAGPPPRSVFGSSFNAANNTFGRRAASPPGRRGFAVPDSSPPGHRDEDSEDDADAEMMEDEPTQTRQTFMHSIGMGSPRGLKRSRNGEVRNEAISGDFAAIARGMSSKTAPLTEPDDLVLQQEALMVRMESRKDLAAAQSAATGLTRLYARQTAATTKDGSIGPENTDGLSRSAYLSSLLLALHHPSPSLKSSATKTTIPRALLDWLETHHNPFPDLYQTVLATDPSPSAHECFWDCIYSLLIRGRLAYAVRLLRTAGWENAATCEDDSQPDGYTDHQLDAIEEVSERAARLLEACPAVNEGNWDVRGPDWELWRQRVRQTLRDLEAFAGEEGEMDVSQMGASKNVFSLSAASKKASSKVPWTVYSNLKLCYIMLLGSPDEILDASQDWLEGCLYMTIWWDGDDASSAEAARSSMRACLSKPRQQQKTREVDVTPSAAYCKRLADAFAYVTADEVEDPVFKPDTLDPVQVGLCCVLTGSVEGAINLLRSWSLPAAEAVTEIAALAGWLPATRPRSRGQGLAVGVMDEDGDGFSSEDLMVLSHGPGGPHRTSGPQSSGQVSRDGILVAYADALVAKAAFVSPDRRTEKEGWELAISVLGRLDDQRQAERKIEGVLEGLELRDEERVDRILVTCGELSLEVQGRSIAEVSTARAQKNWSCADESGQRYADSLAATSSQDLAQQAFGAALLFYARAHSTAKLRSTLSLLTSLSLLHSSSIPATPSLDDTLTSLLSPGREGLVDFARKDPEAAELLAGELSGYAMVRRFYDLRDSLSLNAGSIEKRREAARALLAVLDSASDCIAGGLLDPGREGVVPVEGTLVLLGEALPFLAAGSAKGEIRRGVLSKEQITVLLRVVEDFETVGGSVREDAESLLQASISAYDAEIEASASGKPGSRAPARMAKQSSNLSQSGSGSASSSWELLARSTLGLAQSTTAPRDGGSRKAEVVKRGWDWRKGLEGLRSGGEAVGAKEVVKLVRVGLAGEMGRCFVGGR